MKKTSSSKTRKAMMWPEYRQIDWRPEVGVCAFCEQPIRGKLGIYEGENIILLEDGTTIHDKVPCAMGYLREHYLIKG